MCAINDGGVFGCFNPEFKLENQGTHSSFLNLDINIVDGKSVNKLYDKSDSFPFLIARLPHIDSDVPNILSFIAQLPTFLWFSPKSLWNGSNKGRW